MLCLYIFIFHKCLPMMYFIQPDRMNLDLINILITGEKTRNKITYRCFQQLFYAEQQLLRIASDLFNYIYKTAKLCKATEF